MIDKRLMIGVAAALLATAPPASAQNTRPAELDDANAQLNQTYQRLIRRLGPADQTALRKAQHAWIAFRDADCAFGWGEQLDCLISRTQEREKQLRHSVYFDAAGKFIELPEPD